MAYEGMGSDDRTEAIEKAARELRAVAIKAHNRLQELDELALRTEVREAIAALDAALAGGKK